LGGVIKKISLSASERDEEERAAWRTQAQAEFNPEALVFVDESGCNLALTALYGWAPRGQRVVAQAPRNRGPNTTVLAALTSEVSSILRTGVNGAKLRLLYDGSGVGLGPSRVEVW
jgi:hypothetical protein